MVLVAAEDVAQDRISYTCPKASKIAFFPNMDQIANRRYNQISFRRSTVRFVHCQPMLQLLRSFEDFWVMPIFRGPARKEECKGSTPIIARTSPPTRRLPQHFPLQDLGRPEWQGLITIFRVSRRVGFGILSHLPLFGAECAQKGGEQSRIVGSGGDVWSLVVISCTAEAVTDEGSFGSLVRLLPVRGQGKRCGLQGGSRSGGEG